MKNLLLGIIAINLTIITGLTVLQAIPPKSQFGDPIVNIQKIAICDPYNARCARVLGKEGRLTVWTSAIDVTK